MVKKWIVIYNVYYMDPIYCYELSEIEKGINALATAIENNKPIEQIPKKYMIN